MYLFNSINFYHLIIVLDDILVLRLIQFSTVSVLRFDIKAQNKVNVKNSLVLPSLQGNCQASATLLNSFSGKTRTVVPPLYCHGTHH